MYREEKLAIPDELASGHIPETIVYRDDEQDALKDALSTTDLPNLYIHGPRGTGKTLLMKTGLHALPSNFKTCYISCIQFSTAYQVLRQTCRALEGKDVNAGHHTSHLQERIQDRLAECPLALVLDDVGFLLNHDGGDLFYVLSRMENRENASIFAISSNYENPYPFVDDRVLSSLQPWYITFRKYTAKEAYRILEERLRAAGLLDQVDREALTLIVATTRNIELGLQWLQQAAATAEERITESLLRNVKSAAAQRYRDLQLKKFSRHHHTLLEAISQLTTERNDDIFTGRIYDRYNELCQGQPTEPLGHRRITDLLQHLELLDLISVTHHPGGKQGQTREIHITHFL